MIYHSITHNKYFYNGEEITEAEYMTEVEVIKANAKMADDIIKGVSVIDEVPEEWKAEVSAIIESRTETEEDPEISYAEALEIILGGVT